MVLLTLIARLTDGLPLCASAEDNGVSTFSRPCLQQAHGSMLLGPVLQCPLLFTKKDIFFFFLNIFYKYTHPFLDALLQ